MAARPIVTGADTPVLRAKAKPVAKVTKEVQELLKDMAETCVLADGQGLAAPQIGVSERVIVAVLNERLVGLVNPEITWRSSEMVRDEEGCLSLPHQYVVVARDRAIGVKFLDVNGKPQELRLSDMDARVIQHEVDHLDGILIVDHSAKKKSQPKHDKEEM
jgi:peptide deformylase